MEVLSALVSLHIYHRMSIYTVHQKVEDTHKYLSLDVTQWRKQVVAQDISEPVQD